jgi:predicted HAD superfamily Cof-like phosphohydrolase
MSVDLIELWHQRARPTPTKQDLNVQLGCHFEEIAEMMDTMECTDQSEWNTLKRDIELMSRRLKANAVGVNILFRHDCLDALCDQQVTAIGVAHCAGMKPTEALRRVNTSNWSKYDTNGKPIFNEQGKIAKGPNYKEPDLEGLY